CALPRRAGGGRHSGGPARCARLLTRVATSEQSDDRSHVPVLAAEAVAALRVRADGIYVDGTFGRGGHSRRILDVLGKGGRLVALDRDPDAVAAGRLLERRWRDDRFELFHARFSELERVLDRKSTRLNSS